jgi:hypothetical protein
VTVRVRSRRRRVLRRVELTVHLHERLSHGPMTPGLRELYRDALEAWLERFPGRGVPAWYWRYQPGVPAALRVDVERPDPRVRLAPGHDEVEYEDAQAAWQAHQDRRAAWLAQHGPTL